MVRIQKENSIYINAYIWNLDSGTDEPTCRAGREMQTERMDLGHSRGWRGWDKWRKQQIQIETYTLPCVKQIASGNMLYDTRTQTQCSVTA